MFVIWLDDIRPLDKDYSTMDAGKCMCPKSVNEAKFIIRRLERFGVKDFLLDLDHDLGDYACDGGDGIKLLDWLVETGRNTSNYKVKLHTMNPVGRESMQRMIDRYWDY